MDESDDYISLKEAAALLGYMNTSTLRRDAISGKLKARHVNEWTWLTRPSWVAEYIKVRDNPEGRKPRKGWERGKSRRRPDPQPDPAEEKL